jgi:pimeloyl-ACP methyl ester carboxylesterase
MNPSHTRLMDASRHRQKEITMSSTLTTTAHTRRRFLGSAAVTLLAARLGIAGSARAQTAKESSMTTTLAASSAAPATASEAVTPFTIQVPQADLDDLKQRLAATRFPSKELVADPAQGVQLATVQALTTYWAGDHDWRKLEAKLNALPQFATTIDGIDVHFIQVKSKHANALPLIVTHGWPGSVLEMLGIIGPLTDPTAHGGTKADAFDVVIPSIPGYGFSAQPAEAGWNPFRVAAAWGVLMTRLGYTRYVAQGGDQGANVTDAMGRLAPAGLRGIHTNLLAAFPPAVAAVLFGGAPVPTGLSQEEQQAYADVAAVFKRGYLVEMLEHPQTVGYAQADSPAGLAAWMLDHDADSYQKISQAFLGGQASGGLTKESVVDNVALYWLTNTGVSAARLYWELGRAIAAAAAAKQAPPPMALPAAYTVFPGELVRPPKSWLEQVYPNLAYFGTAEKGGHFAAWEEPELFAAELRAAFKSLR